MSADPLAPTDAELIHSCRAGDARAWEQLVRRYERLIYTIPRRARLDADDAGDVFQTVFLRLHEHLERMNHPDRVHAWLVTTARRETLRLLRERQRMAPAVISAANEDGEPLEFEAVDPDPLPEALLEELQLRHRARRALDALAEPCQSLLRLLYCDEQEPSYARISESLGMPEGSIGPTRARCLAKLRELMERTA